MTNFYKHKKYNYLYLIKSRSRIKNKTRFYIIVRSLNKIKINEKYYFILKLKYVKKIFKG